VKVLGATRWLWVSRSFMHVKSEESIVSPGKAGCGAALLPLEIFMWLCSNVDPSGGSSWSLLQFNTDFRSVSRPSLHPAAASCVCLDEGTSEGHSRSRGARALGTAWPSVGIPACAPRSPRILPKPHPEVT